MVFLWRLALRQESLVVRRCRWLAHPGLSGWSPRFRAGAQRPSDAAR